MNPYLKRLNKIEFVVTNACTGNCKHCSAGGNNPCSERIDPAVAANVVAQVCQSHSIETVMVFGGEPLLHQEAVYAIIKKATALGVPKRQVITNGYFSQNKEKIWEVAQNLALCGVNDLLLSVDAFHQETIPLAVVMEFAKALKENGVSVRLQPAWLVSAEDSNPYNQKTKEILQSMAPLGIFVGEGNIIFPEGNALLYLAPYFKENRPQNPYEENPRDIRCLSVGANGDVLGKNLYKESISQIINAYDPNENG